MTGQTSEMMALRDPDIRLMLRVRDVDDQAAFAELVEKYQHRLVGILGHLVRGADGAEDLAQEAFLRVYRTRKKYTPKAKFSTWLFTIANNLALNSLRDRNRRPTAEWNAHDSGARPEEQLPSVREPQPSGALRKVELAKVVRQALDELNDRQRAAVLLNKFEDMGYAEIAEVMGLTVKGVKSLLNRARCRLREVLQPYIYMDGEAPPIHDDVEDD
ncbi:MAG TPA: sigma-70 family RNA polymerase sigma factor [Fimbriiglobus sp.]|jgi:RNA polymerase sigma-70 factor (ECF subfamily)